MFFLTRFSFASYPNCIHICFIEVQRRTVGEYLFTEYSILALPERGLATAKRPNQTE